jgi:hypothetical protein
LSLESDLRRKLEEHERETVSDSFGGDPIPGRAPSFSVSNIADYLINYIEEHGNLEDVG